MNTLNPRIYIACLAAYNSGYLHGEWVDANQSADDIYTEIQQILAKSPIKNAEEFAIHDFEDFGEVTISEYESIENVALIASFIIEHGELGSAALAHENNNIDQALLILDENYHGEFVSEEDFAYYWIREVECREIPDYLIHYIDYQAMARNFFINDFYSIELNRKIHVLSYL